MWKKGKNLVYLYEKLSILSIGGARLIFINTAKCSTKSLIKNLGCIVLSGCFNFFWGRIVFLSGSSIFFFVTAVQLRW